jgi:hypothetical protein
MVSSQVKSRRVKSSGRERRADLRRRDPDVGMLESTVACVGEVAVDDRVVDGLALVGRVGGDHAHLRWDGMRWDEMGWEGWW